jgi:hypothetical protein
LPRLGCGRAFATSADAADTAAEASGAAIRYDIAVLPLPSRAADR